MGYWNNNGYRSRGGYNRSYGGGNSYRGGFNAPRKRSGCKLCSKDGRIYLTAWRKNRSGFYTLFARDYKGTREITSQSGKVWYNLFVTITNRSTMEQRNYSGLYDASRKRLYIKDLNMIASVNGGQGGYWGQHIGR